MPAFKDNGDGTLTVSGRVTTWVAIILVLITGGSTGYFGITNSAESYTRTQASEAWNAQYLINREVRTSQREEDKMLAEIRTDIKWIKQSLQKR